MATYLDRILAAHRAAAAADTRPLGVLVERALALGPSRPFAAALLARGGASGGHSAGGAPGAPSSLEGLAVIAEVKRRSPSRPALAPDLDAAALARSYAEGGAACLSVLTDADFFGGSPEDLAEARAASGLPTLRKDFTVSAADVCDARLMGADAVLLIVAALDQTELVTLAALARRLGLDALIEVHDEAEAERAVDAGANLIGVNQRDLATFEVDPVRAERVARVLPETVVRVAESGIRDAGDARRLAAAGYQAVLVGESLLTAPDPAAAVQRLSGCTAAGRARA